MTLTWIHSRSCRKHAIFSASHRPLSSNHDRHRGLPNASIPQPRSKNHVSSHRQPATARACSAEYLLRGDTIASLHAAADRSVRHPDYRRRLGWQYDFNWFAMPFWQTGQWDAAAEMFAAIGDQMTLRPWEMYNYYNPAGVFARARDEVDQNRAPRVKP